MIARSRSLATTVALALAAGGITLVAAGPAQATRSCGTGPPPPPLQSVTFTGSAIDVSDYYFTCQTLPDQEPLVDISENGTVVASGYGGAVYHCASTATDNSFYITYFGTYTFACS
jgi:hypothetical protein